MNVTDNDKGTYSCQMFCEWDEWENTSASIELKVYEPQIGKKVLFRSILGNRWLVDCSIGWSVCWFVGWWLVSWLIDWLVIWLVDCSIGWSVCWLVVG